jgi:hypothetical protein
VRDMPVPGPADSARVTALFEALTAPTHPLRFPQDLDKRTAVIDQRIERAQPTLAEKVAVLRKLASTGATGDSEELRMERLLLSIAPADLPLFKFALEYDLDYKDLEEYVFHDIDNADRQRRILAHLRRTPPSAGIKVLTDVDDTLYANFLDQRYPKGQIYPGVLAFYDAVKEELFGPMPAIPVTTLSARPNPVAGHLEAASLAGLAERTKHCAKPLCPSALSGALVSSGLGSVQDLLRAHRSRRRAQSTEALEADDHALADRPEPGADGPEQANDIGRAKFANFARYSAIYPEYRYVFCGDSGQADALTARLLLGDTSTEGARAPFMTADGTSRVITTFIQDLRQGDRDDAAASAAFRGALGADLVVRRDSATGRGIIVHRDYIEAAIIAYIHRKTLKDLVTVEKLAHVTRAALLDLKAPPPASTRTPARGVLDADRLLPQYRAHSEEAFALLTAAPQTPALTEAAKEIRQILDAER